MQSQPFTLSFPSPWAGLNSFDAKSPPTTPLFIHVLIHSFTQQILIIYHLYEPGAVSDPRNPGRTENVPALQQPIV